MLLDRPALLKRVRDGLAARPVVALLGPRQCGKTTLARELTAMDGGTHFDLENPRDEARLRNPQLALESLTGIVVLDEIHRRPELMDLLRVLADRRPIRCRFLILGSASPELMRGASETLAGRIHFVRMDGFSLDEVGAKNVKRLWLRGGFPDSYLAPSDESSLTWRSDFTETFLQRDMAQLGFRFPAATLRRFWTMVAHSHGQVWNGTDIGASLGVSHHASRRYLDALVGAYMIRSLPPWFVNVGKRVVKSPKVYVRDSGLLHALLNIDTRSSLESHPKLGASWEGFVIEQVLARAGERDAYFWATHSRAELDLLMIRKGRKWGFEVKYADAPQLTRSLLIAMEDLELERVWVVYPGGDRYSLDKRVECVGPQHLEEVCAMLE